MGLKQLLVPQSGFATRCVVDEELQVFGWRTARQSAPATWVGCVSRARFPAGCGSIGDCFNPVWRSGRKPADRFEKHWTGYRPL